jgi:hypothetical protein
VFGGKYQKTNFNQIITNESLPKELTHLNLSNGFNKIIKPVVLPYNKM